MWTYPSANYAHVTCGCGGFASIRWWCYADRRVDGLTGLMRTFHRPVVS